MPGFLSIKGTAPPQQAKCREHGDIGPVREHPGEAEQDLRAHAWEHHPWWYDPIEIFDGPAFVAQRQVVCELHRDLGKAYDTYEEAAAAARKHNKEQHAPQQVGARPQP